MRKSDTSKITGVATGVIFLNKKPAGTTKKTDISV